MTTTDYALSAALILVVLRQLKGRRLQGLSLYLPLGIVAYAAYKYLHTVPTQGNDLMLVFLCIGAGLALGVLTGIFTRVYPDHDGVPFARATVIAAGLWVLGVSARMAFSLYAQHGGGPSIERFSSAHALSVQAWGAALILMALAEVVSRTAVLVVRGRRLETPAIMPA
jgi:hypothetical protein